MAYKYNVVRLERIKTDGVFTQLVVGINCLNDVSGQSAYMDWTFNKDALTKPITKASAKADIKVYLTKVQNQDAITAATEAKKTDATVEIPSAQKLIDNLKDRTNAPIITREADTSLDGNSEIII